jgi:hypothetical protein
MCEIGFQEYTTEDAEGFQFLPGLKLQFSHVERG